MLRQRAIYLLVLWLYLSPDAASAHGDLHDQIQILTQSIKTNPTNAVLYHQRGELHRAHTDYKYALLDYSTAHKLDPSLDVVYLSRGRALHESGESMKALHELNEFILRHPKHLEALWLRGQVQAKVGMRRHAEIAFQMVIESSEETSPDQHIERANNLKAEGKLEPALAALKDGITRLGPLVTLELAALEIEMALKDQKAALTRIDALIASAERKELYLVRKGEVFEMAGDKSEASRCYREALAAIANLPERQRKLKSTVELERTVHNRLNPGATKP